MRGTMSRRWAIFAVTSLSFFLSQFYRASNAVIAPQLANDLCLDTQGLGLISASFFYAFALTQIPISLLLDKVGPRRMMTVLSLLGTLGAFVFSSADSLTIGVVGRVFLGVGMACHLMGTLKLLTVWFGPLRFATLSGIVFSIGTVGNMAATIPLVFLVQLMGWRMTFVLIGGVNLLISLVLYLVLRDRPQGKGLDVPPTSEATTTLHRRFSGLGLLLKKADYWIISLGTFVRYGIFAAFQTLWAGPYLMEVMGFSALNTGNLIFLMNIGIVLGGPTWGTLSDRLFKTAKWIVLFGLGMLSFITFIIARLSPGVAPLSLGLLFFGFGLFGSAGSLMYAHIKELMPMEMAGTAMTGINFFTMIGPAVFLQGIGGLMQHLYPHASRGPDAFRMVLTLCAACLAGVSLLYLLTRDTTDQGAAGS
jgi:sugar phosphate permease